MSTTLEEEKIEGAFMESLVRNNKKIRDDRAAAIGEDTRTAYKRTVEDLERNIRKMKRARENMLDLSPTDADSLVLKKDFSEEDYVDKDIELGVKIWKEEQRLAIAQERYNYLFSAGVE